MLNKVYNALDSIKREDNIITQFLKLMFTIGKVGWIHAVISVIAGIFIPIIWDKGQIGWSVVLLLLTICDIIYAYVCNGYQKRLYEERKFSVELLNELSSLLRSLNIYVVNNENWKEDIFHKTSEMACEKIYSIFRQIFRCETRVSVEYVFDKVNEETFQPETYVKMSGRRSFHRSGGRKAELLETREGYCSYRIFKENNAGTNILNREHINDPEKWHQKPNANTNVSRYIGIAECVLNDRIVRYILQIDFMNDFSFGSTNSEEEVRNFIERYLMVYTNMITFSYLLNFDNAKTIGEV